MIAVYLYAEPQSYVEARQEIESQPDQVRESLRTQE